MCYFVSVLIREDNLRGALSVMQARRYKPVNDGCTLGGCFTPLSSASLSPVTISSTLSIRYKLYVRSTPRPGTNGVEEKVRGSTFPSLFPPRKRVITSSPTLIGLPFLSLTWAIMSTLRMRSACVLVLTRYWEFRQ